MTAVGLARAEVLSWAICLVVSLYGLSCGGDDEQYLDTKLTFHSALEELSDTAAEVLIVGIPNALSQTGLSLGEDFVVRGKGFVGAVEASLGDQMTIELKDGSENVDSVTLRLSDDYVSLIRPELCGTCSWMLGEPVEGKAPVALDALDGSDASWVIANRTNGASLRTEEQIAVEIDADSGDLVCVFQHDTSTHRSSTMYCESVP